MLSILNYDSAVASAASRMTSAAGSRPCLEMGSRRAHEQAAVAAARAATVAGFTGTSNLEAGRRYGIPTIGTVRWASDQILRRLLPQGHVPEFTDPSGRIVIAEVPLDISWVGQRISTIEAATGTRVAFVTRLGQGMLPDPDTVYQAGDLVHVAAVHQQLSQVERILDTPPAEEGGQR